MTSDTLKDDINAVLRNFGIWSRMGGWPILTYSCLPTSRDCLAGVDWRDKTNKGPEPDVVSAEAANFAIANLMKKGDARSVQIIIARWVYNYTAKDIARKLHCSHRAMWYYRERAMYAFWPEYCNVLEENKAKAKKIFDPLHTMAYSAQ